MSACGRVAGRDRLRKAIAKADTDYTGLIGSYMFRHLFAAHMKDQMPLARLASIMRTSVKMLEQTYGKQSDDSFREQLDKASFAVWGDEPITPPGAA